RHHRLMRMPLFQRANVRQLQYLVYGRQFAKGVVSHTNGSKFVLSAYCPADAITTWLNDPALSNLTYGGDATVILRITTKMIVNRLITSCYEYSGMLDGLSRRTKLGSLLLHS